MAETAALLADEVFPDVPLRQWVISFPFPLRYLFAAHPQAMGKVLSIVYRAIATHLVHKAGYQLKDGATGAVTLIQRFGSALNLNIHFHILFLDGLYLYRDNWPPRFKRVRAPDISELENLVQLISQRVGRCLERQGLLEQDAEQAWLDLDPADDTDAMPRLSLSSTGKVVYTLKTPYRDGTTQVAFHPVDFMARLAALVPKPRVNLTRYHGVLAPNHRWRGWVTPARRGKGLKTIGNAEAKSPAERHAAMTWAQTLKRVFDIDIEICGRCGGSAKVIACIEEQETVDRILAHLRQQEQDTPTRPLLVPPTRAPPDTLPLFTGKGAR